MNGFVIGHQGDKAAQVAGEAFSRLLPHQADLGISVVLVPFNQDKFNKKYGLK